MTAACRGVVRWLAAVALTAHLVLAAPPATRSLSQLKPGQKGTGRTVFKGEAIETFDFEVVDLLKTDGFNTDLILIKVSGPQVDAIGGIAYGMSGSPLYIDNDLIGAVAMTTADTDAHYGYATPIADMIKMWDTLPAKPAPVGGQASVLDMLPVGTPVQLRGLSARARAPLARLLAAHGLRVQTGPAPSPAQPIDPAAPSEAPIEAGSAISCALTTGDVSVEATGTVTWRDGDRILAFGHPFLRGGASSLFMQKAYVATILPSRTMPTKVAFPSSQPIGTFTVDRAAGIGGVVGAKTPKFEVSITVKDTDLNRERVLRLDVIRDPRLVPALVGSALLQAMDEVMDREGAGTASLSWKLDAEGLAAPFVREDLLYSNADILSEAVAGPLFGLEALLRNDFAALDPKRIELTVNVSTERRTVRLTGITVEPNKAKPGQSVKVTCQLQPYRGQPFTRELLMVVPKTAAPGRLVVDVHGRDRAGTGPLNQAALLAGGLPVPTSLADLLRTVAASQRGDTLWAEILSPEAAAARQQASDQLAALPSADPFGEETVAVPTLDLPTGATAVPLAKAEARLDKVVLGRLRESLTVLAP
ncbi:MAG: hypothetical protein HZB16_22520 [Armatimonadetes bacterium]|nr:hypothetical protein [Armatimonadota bacterium]